MRILITLTVVADVNEVKEARTLLNYLENEAAKKNCELWDSGLVNDDTGEDIEDED